MRSSIAKKLDATNGDALKTARLLTDQEKREIILWALVELRKRIERERSLAIEKEHFSLHIDRDDESEEEVAKQKAESEQELEMIRVFQKPETMYGKNGRGYWNCKDRKKFRRFLANTGRDFYKWLNRARKVAIDREFFEADWHEGGVWAYHEKRMIGDLSKGIAVLVEHEAKKLKLKITEELLNTVFSLGDGREITWRDATIADHKQRVKMLVGSAAATAATATRHKKVIQLLKQKRVKCLGSILLTEAS